MDTTQAFTIHFRDGRQVVIRAEVIRPPNGASQFYTLETQGVPVAEFYRDAVSGWSTSPPVEL